MIDEEFALVEKTIRAERSGISDFSIAGLLAFLVYAAQLVWEYPWLHPSVWNDAAIAAGVRPAVQVMPGYCTALVSLVYATCGITLGEWVLRCIGHLMLGGFAFCAYLMLRDWLSYPMRLRGQFSPRRKAVLQLASAFGAFAFVCADPVWTAGQCLSETTILLLLTMLSLRSFFDFLKRGNGASAYHGAILLGLLAAESPLGIILPMMFFLLGTFMIRAMPTAASPLFNRPAVEVAKWHVTFLYLLSIVVGIAFNSLMYIHNGGIDAIGETVGSIPIAYLRQYCSMAAKAGNTGAWILWFGACIAPFLVTILHFPVAADEERFLQYGTGMTFFFCGLIAMSQFTFLSALWFWKYFPMESQYILSLGIFCSASTLASGLAVLGVDAFCRNHGQLAWQMLGDEAMDGMSSPRHTPFSGVLKVLRKYYIFVIPVFLLAMIVPSRIKPTTREMLTVIRDAVNEIVDENEGARFLFTDGNLDSAIELESARRGTPVNCFSMMGGDGAMAIYLRTRGLGTDEEDLFSFRFDTAMGMRGWIHDKPEKLSDCSALMGFDLWKRDGKPIPPMGGMLSRPAGFRDEPTRLEGVRRARELADRILEINAKSGGIRVCMDRDIVRAFQIVQWRLARMCLYRSEVCDSHGMTKEALSESDLAKKLNDGNSLYQDLVRSMERMSAAMMQKLTPREGLQLSLVRADFTTGKIYAEKILTADKDDPDANFAMGMYYLRQHQLSRAEEFLGRCLVRKPREPAIYNNLAMIQIETKRYEDARKNIDMALKLIPDSAEVLDTRKALESAVKAAGKKR